VKRSSKGVRESSSGAPVRYQREREVSLGLKHPGLDIRSENASGEHSYNKEDFAFNKRIHDLYS
jgi:hypothetical protein